MIQPLNPQQIEAFLNSPCRLMPVITWRQWIGEVIKAVIREGVRFDGSCLLGCSYWSTELARDLSERFPDLGLRVDEYEDEYTINDWNLGIQAFNKIIDYLIER